MDLWMDGWSMEEEKEEEDADGWRDEERNKVTEKDI